MKPRDPPSGINKMTDKLDRVNIKNIRSSKSIIKKVKRGPTDREQTARDSSVVHTSNSSESVSKTDNLIFSGSEGLEHTRQPGTSSSSVTGEKMLNEFHHRGDAR